MSCLNFLGLLDALEQEVVIILRGGSVVDLHRIVRGHLQGDDAAFLNSEYLLTRRGVGERAEAVRERVEQREVVLRVERVAARPQRGRDKHRLVDGAVAELGSIDIWANIAGADILTGNGQARTVLCFKG